MDRTYYASVESGRQNISIESIQKIADGFDMFLDELFTHYEKIKRDQKEY